MSKNQAKTAASEPVRTLDELTPRQIVAELDRYVVGQQKAKRAVAIALRNRVRRQKLPAESSEEVQPKNLIMIGPTGVGKTEIARRLARISNSPFIKLEASKFTEVGYVGRDVDSIIRDLVEVGVQMVREQRVGEIEKKAERNAEERLLDLLLSATKRKKAARKKLVGKKLRGAKKFKKIREKLRQQLRAGKLDRRRVELEVPERMAPSIDLIGFGADEVDLNLGDIFSGMFQQTTRRKMDVGEAIDYLIFQEENKLIDMEQITREALQRVEQSGIVFLDELDKIAGRETGQGPNVSREGVQRDILPIIEGTTVSTRYGMVQTDHILFVAAGAFHVSKPSDLIPELQGRFPIRVEMEPLVEADLVRILTEPENSLIRQYTALMKTDGIDLVFTEEAIQLIAHYAKSVNDATENIGARRLHTIMEALLEDLSFEGGDFKDKRFVVDDDYVRSQLKDIVKDEDLSRYIL